MFLKHILAVVGVLRAVLATAGGQEMLITDIHFVGNEVTKPYILLQEMVIESGDPVDIERIEQSRQAIMDLGLFKSVTARLIPNELGQELEIAVSEKHYLIPLPHLDRTADGEVSYGGRLRWDNIGGLNQNIKVIYKAQRGCCQTNRTVNTLSMTYSYPRVAGTQYGLEGVLSFSASPLEVVDGTGAVISEYNENFRQSAVGLWRWLSREGPSAGWSLGGSVFAKERYYEWQTGATQSFDNGKAVGLTAVLRYIRIHDYLYSRSGLENGYVTEQGVDELGSGSSYSRNEVFYRHYFPVGDVYTHKNINLQMLFGFSGGDIPYADNAFALGGSKTLRAYEKNSIEGRSFFLTNVEYLQPLWGHNAARGVLFYDVGNAYSDNRVIDVKDLESDAGFGLRYKFKSFVHFELRMDVAYAFRSPGSKFYIGSKGTF